MASIQFSNVRKSFGDTHVIKGVDLDIDEGEFCVFVGPSGCGKSTMLRLIAGLEDITSGELFIGGERVNELEPSKRGVAIVFQSYALYPHMNVFNNMAFGLKLAKESKAEIEKRVREAAKTLQIEHLLERLPKQLSGGQRQRVAIGRAITRQPKVFLFDEPLSNLDAALRVQTRIEIAKLHERLKSTMVYVTHDQVEAMTLADKIVILNAGHVAQVGAPLELYHGPENLFVAGFIGSPKMNFIDAKIEKSEEQGADVNLSTGVSVRVPVDAKSADKGTKVTLGIRPEHVKRVTNGGDGQIKGEVQFVEHLGEGSLIYVGTEFSDDPITVKEDGDAKVKAGNTIAMEFPEASCHLFNTEEKAFKRLVDQTHS
ncbi:MAG: sn-glycerol-3-phosphate ABC transporter ATP-binding protein UgpC [Proteobacteria bacterium]|nr:sn-glycerol-3-phosphate ABC transporter ATP-binding protein UgpC [Pseudomonadota bacterium]